MRSHPLRYQLALTYAGIALLTAAVLGGALLAVLGNYYARAENAYLQAAAARIDGEPFPGTNAAQLKTWAQLQALGTQTRVQIISAQGVVIADSGSPRDLDPGALLPRGALRNRRDARPDRLPDPHGGTLFGEPGGAARSSRTLRLPLAATSGDTGGYLQLSEAPTSGRDALVGVAQAWSVAAALAVALAALAGYLLSSRITRPIVALTHASDRMTEGDLSARAPVESEDEVGRLSASFNAMADSMESTVTSLRRFVADAAHEIGTPLTALQADLDLADESASTDDEHRLVRRALVQAQRIERLSADLLKLSRIETGESFGPSERVDVAALARTAADACASRAEQAGLALLTDIAQQPLAVMAESAKLSAVIENLLDNALKFTPSGGSVTLSAGTDGDFAVISVADTGVGIPLAEQDRVFDRFHRARNVAAYPGSGLGLAIVQATTQRFGGSVTLDSSDAGTRFDLRLPLA